MYINTKGTETKANYCPKRYLALNSRIKYPKISTFANSALFFFTFLTSLKVIKVVLEDIILRFWALNYFNEVLLSLEQIKSNNAFYQKTDKL